MVPTCYRDRLVVYQRFSELMPLVPVKKDLKLCKNFKHEEIIMSAC